MITDIDWNKWASLATIVYSVAFILSLSFILWQLLEIRRARSLQAILAIFEELQTPEARLARRYIYTRLPRETEGIPEDELTEHLINTEEAFITFDRVGYLVRERYIPSSDIIGFLWLPIWKCWKKSEKLILHIRQRRNEQTYLESFRRMYLLSELHRVSNRYEEPTI